MPQRQRDGMDALDPEPLLRFLFERGIEHVLIGGVAVAAHGYRRPSKDLDIVPAPAGENLGRLAQALRLLHARPTEFGDFAPGLAHLRAMKLAAGRPRDLDDLEHLPEP